jgi:PhnB protein
MSSNVKPIPEGHHTITPRIFVVGAAEAIAFYQQAFNAIELGRHTDPSGKIVNADIKFGNSMISLADASPEWANHSPQTLSGTTVIFTLNVEDADTTWAQAITAGAKVIFPLKDQFYGFRQGRLEDPFGHLWIISTQISQIAAT